MKELIPGAGEKSAKERLRELEKKAGTLPVIFALLFTEAVKITVAGIPVPLFPETAWFHFLGEALKFLLLAIAVAAAYVFEEERRQYVGLAKEKSQEKVEEAKEKAEGDKDKPDYELGIGLLGKKVKCSFNFNRNE